MKFDTVILLETWLVGGVGEVALDGDKLLLPGLITGMTALLYM